MRCAALMLCLLSTAFAARVEYRVQAGDTAYSIAKRHAVTVEALLTTNRLTAPDLRIGQVLLIDVPDPVANTVPALVNTAPPANVTAPAAPPAPAPAGSAPPVAPVHTHTVAPGDTMYSIARRAGSTVEALLVLNGLKTPDLKLGQVLRLPGPAPAAQAASAVPTAALAALLAPTGPVAGPPAPVVTVPATPVELAPVPDGSGLRDVALRFLGVPYRYGGTAPSTGLDCSGLVLQVFTALGVQLPRSSAEQYGAGRPVDVAEVREGDLLFFDIEGKGTVTHVGIALDTRMFVHANSWNGKVTVNSLTEQYYADRYLGARRVLDAAQETAND